MDSFLQKFNYKTINDAIYGNFGLSELEVKLLDTKAMQRLRRIRQMGFSSYVFPCGEHTRFVHSLGVLCIMGKMCNALFCKGLISEEEVINLRVAALLHDVGHYPFSHLTELVYGYIDLGKEPILEKPVNEGESLLSIMASQKKRRVCDHEHLGLEVIKKDPEIKEILSHANINAELIGKIITGEIGIYEDKSIVYTQLMHSTLDADRMDYLLRDSRQAGVVFGNIDLDYIVNNMCIVNDKVDEGKEISLIAIHDKAQSAVEHFLMARYFHYSRTILHKSSMAFETVAKVLIYKMLNENSNTFYSTYQKLVDSIGNQEFYDFTDDFMWVQLGDFTRTSNNTYIDKLWNTLNGRKKPRIVACYKDLQLKQAKKDAMHDSKFFLVDRFLENKQKEIADEFSIDINCIGHIKSYLSIDSIPDYLRIEDCKKDFKEESLREAVKMVNREGNVSFLALDDKSMINKMIDYCSVSLVFFIVDNDETYNLKDIKDFVDTNL